MISRLQTVGCLSRRFSRHRMSVSDFIHDRLYAKGDGYFSKKDNQLGLLRDPIHFTELFGYEDYQKVLRERYPENAWLTPSEIFKPYYGMTIAAYIDQTFNKLKQLDSSARHKPLSIMEGGAGNGSAASSILNYFKMYKPQTYRSLRYTIVEISEAMIDRCRQALSVTHPQLVSNGQIVFRNQSIVDLEENSKDATFILLLEVLDNLPHDRLYFAGDQLEMAMVEMEGENFKEVRQKEIDPDLLILYHMWREVESSREDVEAENNKEGFFSRIYRSLTKPKQIDNVFLPTHCLKMIRNLNEKFPKAELIFSDFDMLRNCSSNSIGFNAPTVSTKLADADAKKDYRDYLVPRGAADIFFPTDFKLLRTMHRRLTGKPSLVLKSHEFVDEYSDKNWVTTQSGYNPLKEDFANTSFFLSKNA